jgi:hypothetical protein
MQKRDPMRYQTEIGRRNAIADASGRTLWNLDPSDGAATELLLNNTGLSLP